MNNDKGKLDIVVLAGGLGTRMHPITIYKPKPLVIYKGKPLLCRIIDSLNEFAGKIIVVTKYLPEHFLDITYSYNNVILHHSQSDSMAGSFFEACRMTDTDFVIGISSDITYHKNMAIDAINKWDHDENSVHIFLTNSASQQYKKWNWIIDEGELIDLAIDKQPTGFEKLFIIFPRKFILLFARNHKIDTTSNKNELVELPGYNKGWIYIIKSMLLDNIKIKVTCLDGAINNINSANDLKK